MELTWQPITDAATWADLGARIERVDDTGEILGTDDLAEELDDATMRPEHFQGVWAGDTMVGWAAVRPRQPHEGVLAFHVDGGVDPDHRGRGIGTQLLGWVVRASTSYRDELHPDLPVLLRSVGYHSNPHQIALLRESGFADELWEAQMERSCREPMTTVTTVDGFRIETYDKARSAEIRAAHNDAFRDFTAFVPWTAQLWEQWVDGTAVSRPDLSRIAYTTDDRVAAYVLCDEFPAVQEKTGLRELYIGKVGVIREMRGRGLARALLSAVVQAAIDGGFDTLSLDADTNSPTGAFTLYESVGFTVRRRHDEYHLTLPATMPAAALRS